MKVKDLVNAFASDVKYEIRNKDNPSLVYWYGCGNNLNIWDREENVASIQHTPKKLIIYV
jgi:hypothetical protein